MLLKRKEAGEKALRSQSPNEHRAPSIERAFPAHGGATFNTCLDTKYCQLSMHVHLRCHGPLKSGPFVQGENQRSLNPRHQSRIWFSLKYQYQGCSLLHSNCQKGATPPGAGFSRPGLNHLSHSLSLRFLLMVPKLNAEI